MSSRKERYIDHIVETKGLHEHQKADYRRRARSEDLGSRFAGSYSFHNDDWKLRCLAEASALQSALLAEGVKCSDPTLPKDCQRAKLKLKGGLGWFEVDARGRVFNFLEPDKVNGHPDAPSIIKALRRFKKASERR